MILREESPVKPSPANIKGYGKVAKAMVLIWGMRDHFVLFWDHLAI